MRRSLKLFLKRADMLDADARRAGGQLHNVKIVDHSGLQRGTQASAHQFSDRFTQRDLAARRVCLYFRKNIIL